MAIPTSIVVHKDCGKKSDIGRQIAAAHRKDPKVFVNFFCHHCQQHRPTGEFEFDAAPVDAQLEEPAPTESTAQVEQ